LPKEHSSAIGRDYADNFSGLVDALKIRSLRLTTNVEIVGVETTTTTSAGDRKTVDLKIRFRLVSFAVSTLSLSVLISP